MVVDDKHKPKLLIFAQWYTPGYKAGGPIRSVQNLIDLLKNDFQIFVFSADRDHGDDKPYKDVIVNDWLHKTGHSVFYADKVHLTLSFLKQMIGDINPDAVFLNSMFAYRFFLLPLLALRQIKFKGKIILSPRGMLRSSALQFKKFKKSIFLSILKNTNLLNGIEYQATNEDEAIEIQSILKASPEKVHIMDNVPYAGGVDTPVIKISGKLNLIFLGRIHPIKGLDFVLDLLRDAKEKINLDIVGTIENHDYFAKCQAKIKSLPSNVSVILQEDIPFEQAIENLYKNHFLISPTQGENFGHAIFESLALGRPVIISDQTPWRNLEEKKIGWDIALSDISKFKYAISEAASLDQQQFDEYAKNAREFARHYILSSNLKEKYTSLFTTNTRASQT